jgi:DNA-binding NarL/FixJ family response regulator
MLIYVLIADDHPILRKGIVAELKVYEDIKIVHEVQNGREVMDYISSGAHIDVLLLDLDMPKMSGMEVLAELKKLSKPINTIILSMHKDDDTIRRVIEAGAHGYICKEEGPEEIYRAIKSTMAQGFYFGDVSNKAMLHNLLHKDHAPLPLPDSKTDFTDRELKVIRYLSQEMTNEEIAKEMYLSIRTVEGIRQQLIQKAGVKNAIGLVLYAQKKQLLTKC